MIIPVVEMQSPCVLPSNAPALESLPVDSEDIGSDSSDNKSRTSRTNLRTVKKKKRTRSKPQAIDPYGNKIPLNLVRDPVLTNVEFQSPKYINYRSKQRNPKRTKNGQVWTGELEEAFQAALRAIPVLGRKQLQIPAYGEKFWGRNELISHFIEARTGIVRDRKKVSSHIQVLKKFLVQNGTWMALVTQPDQNQPQNCYGSKDIERRSSTHVLKSESHDHLDVNPNPYFDPTPPPAHGILPSSVISQGYSVRRANFEMYILDQDLERLHVYSSLQSEIGSAPRELESILNWQSIYPPLAMYHDQGQLDGEIILFETNFNLMDRHPPPKSNLSIDFTIDIARGIELMKWECHSKFYERGVLQKSLSTPMDSEYLASTSDARIVVLLHSRWWVDQFTDMTKQKQEIEEGDFDAVEQGEERIRCQIRDISVVQEIWATHQAGGSSQRIAILIWSFRQTRNHEVATTTWRKLIPPSRNAKPYPPISGSATPYIQSPYTVDNAPQHHEFQQQIPSYAQSSKPEPFFAENSETLFVETYAQLSPSSTPLHDFNSLPSSTSTSFPSSISSSTVPPELSQESPFASQEPFFHSQEPEYQGQELDFDPQDPVFNSVDVECSPENLHTRFSQDSTYYPQDTIKLKPQEPNFPPQDHYYISEATAYRTQDDGSPYSAHTYARYQSNHDAYVIVEHKEIDAANSIQEFNGLQSQVSFAETHNSSTPYDAPYVAPLISMLTPEPLHYNEPQHQPPSLHTHSQKSPNESLRSQNLHRDCFGIDEWQIIDHNVGLSNNQPFQPNGDLEEATGMMKQHGQVLGEIGELEKGIDAELAF